MTEKEHTLTAEGSSVDLVTRRLDKLHGDLATKLGVSDLQPAKEMWTVRVTAAKGPVTGEGASYDAARKMLEDYSLAADVTEEVSATRTYMVNAEQAAKATATRKPSTACAVKEGSDYDFGF